MKLDPRSSAWDLDGKNRFLSMSEVSLQLIMMTSIYLIRAYQCLTKKNAFVSVSKYEARLLHQGDTPRWATPFPVSWLLICNPALLGTTACVHSLVMLSLFDKYIFP